MSERLPYEEQLQQRWNDLPLPDENMAWADMKRRLDKDDNDGIVWWRPGCALWGLALLLLLALGWWLMHEMRTHDKNREQQKISQTAERTINTNKDIKDSTGGLTNNNNIPQDIATKEPENEPKKKQVNPLPVMQEEKIIP